MAFFIVKYLSCLVVQMGGRWLDAKPEMFIYCQTWDVYLSECFYSDNDWVFMLLWVCLLGMPCSSGCVLDYKAEPLPCNSLLCHVRVHSQGQDQQIKSSTFSEVQQRIIILLRNQRSITPSYCCSLILIIWQCRIARRTQQHRKMDTEWCCSEHEMSSH